ncbi:MAG TPA: hypothetical protein VFE60_02430 [Roseiarcus sp.]|jgi:hypothetical protein|nr:hypothetical protein [Roseiarcus sp.]
MSATPAEAIAAATRAQAEAILDDGVDASPSHQRAKPLIAHWLNWLRSQKSPSLSRKGSQEAIGCGPSREIQLEESGAIDAYNEGSIKRISTRSIARHGIMQALLSHPLNAPPAKIRQPAARYQKRPRERTPQESEGLRKGNEGRALEAARKREARTAARV